MCGDAQQHYRLTGSGAYWAGQVVASPCFVSYGQAILLALPLFATPK